MIFVKYTKKYRNKLSKYFQCDNKYLDSFLAGDISLDDSFGTTYICLNNDRNEIIAYYNIGTGALINKSSNDGNKMGGSVHLNCFALDKKYHGITMVEDKETYKFSDYLLNMCISKIMNIRKRKIGFSFITLYSTNAGYNLYKRNGFEDLELDMELPYDYSELQCKPMYYPLIEV